MAIKVQSVINRAMEIIGAESRYSDPNYDVRQFALDTLNDILFLMNTTGKMLPYQTSVDFLLNSGQKTYTIGTATSNDVVILTPLVALDYVTLLINNIQYPITILDNFALLNQIVVNTTIGRPVTLWPQYRDNLIELNFYPTPDQTYTCRVLYKPTLGEVTYASTIDLPLQYRMWLCYRLAKSMDDVGRLNNWGEKQEMALKEQDNLLSSAAIKDNRVRTAPPIRHDYNQLTYYWGFYK